jgi:hypothetical protein
VSKAPSLGTFRGYDVPTDIGLYTCRKEMLMRVLLTCDRLDPPARMKARIIHQSLLPLGDLFVVHGQQGASLYIKCSGGRHGHDGFYSQNKLARKFKIGVRIWN